MIITDEVLYRADKNTNHVTTVLAGVCACACTCRYGCACGCGCVCTCRCACVSYYHNRQNVTFLNLRHRCLKLRLISAYTLNNNRNNYVNRNSIPPQHEYYHCYPYHSSHWTHKRSATNWTSSGDQCKTRPPNS